jgi:hypothetical protein
LAAGTAMLGKYWSIFLLAGLGLAVLTDPRRGAYFRSAAPWLTIAAGAAVLGPHLYFIATHGFTTVDFAFTSHATTRTHAAAGALYFIFSVLGYIAAPIVVAALATWSPKNWRQKEWPNAAAVKDTLWPATPERRTIVIAFAAPIVLAAFAGIVTRADLDPLWTISAMTLLPVVLLSSPLVTVNRAAAVYVLVLAIAVPLVMVAASPVIAFVIHRQGLTNYASQYRLIAQTVEQTWQAQTDKPLRILGGNRPIVDGSNFYFAEPPATFVVTEPARTPWVDSARIEREGIAIVCPLLDPPCMNALNRYVANSSGKSADVTLARSFFGTTDTPIDYRIAIIPPR